MAKGNHNDLATYGVHSYSKNSNKSKLVKAMYRVYHESQEFNCLRAGYALYSKKNHRNVRHNYIYFIQYLSVGQ